MIALVNAIAGLVRRLPAATVVGALLLTGVFAGLSTQLEFASGNEGFAPDNEQLAAIETIADRFGSSGEEVMQFVVSAPGGDVLGGDGMRAVAALTAALVDSDDAHHLATGGPRPAIVSPLGPVLGALEAQGADLADVDDETVGAVFLDILASLPDQEAAGITALLPDDADLAAPSADALLVIVFLSTDDLPANGTERFDALIEIQDRLVREATAIEVAPGIEVTGFSFPLLFADTESFEAELARLFATAFGVIVLILVTVYWLWPRGALTAVRAGRRTFADVGLTMATIVMAIVWMNGAAALLGPAYLGVIGRLTEMTQIIPVLLIGLGVDYAIHLTSRYREEVGEGASVDEGIVRAIRTVGIALGLATVTTAVGFLTNIFNPVPTLRDFGVVAAVGIFAAFALMLTFVPAARLLLDRRAERAGRLPTTALEQTSRRFLPEAMSRTAILAERVPVATLVVTVALGGALGVWGLSQLETRFSSTDFVAPDNPILDAMESIGERFGGGFGETTEVLVSGDVARPEIHNAVADALDRLADVEWVVMMGDHPAAESPHSALGVLLAPGPDGDPPVPAVAEAAGRAGVDADLRVGSDADVADLYAAMVADAPQVAGRVLDLEEGHLRVGVRTTAGEEHAADLLAALDAAFAPVRAAGVDVVVTSNPIINHVIISALQDSQVTSLAITLGAVLLLLAATFFVRERRPALGVITTLPVVLALLWTFAMMAATNVPFGPVTAMIAALAIGIGIPYAIHVTNRFLEDHRRLPPVEAVRSTVRHTGGALAGSALTTCAGFGVLVTSSLVPFRQFGLVTVYAIGFALLAATLVLPSALVLWDRWHRRGVPSGPGGDRVELPDPSSAEIPLPVVDPDEEAVRSPTPA